ncbi:MAG: tRNA pseudouridine(38-40) synthase TruA [Tenericutes bacterium HGW-Tenericutes-8]|nr:MAG: tRNA pseudouridine(38-40) synthase TruA [Tenericutes bacterium HGW-Tenericutes-8]
MRFKVTVAYDGAAYQGFQSQTNGLGIQAVIEDTMFRITSEKMSIVASGRTDKGVHALGQVFHFDAHQQMDEQAWFRSLNTYLPADIRALKIEAVTDTFHARYSVKQKQYIYLLAKDYNLFARHHEAYIKYPLDMDKMKQAIQDLVGTHDYKGFGVYVEHKPTIKTMFEATLEETDTHLIFSFTANGFLKYMVRSIVGTLTDIGRGKKDVSTIKTILDTQDRHLVGKTASPEGLYLKQVWY